MNDGINSLDPDAARRLFVMGKIRNQYERTCCLCTDGRSFQVKALWTVVLFVECRIHIVYVLLVHLLPCLLDGFTETIKVKLELPGDVTIVLCCSDSNY